MFRQSAKQPISLEPETAALKKARPARFAVQELSGSMVPMSSAMNATS